MKTIILISLKTLLIIIFFSTNSLFSQDTKAPSVKVKSGILEYKIEMNGYAVISAISLDDGSIDDTSPQDKLKFYFGGDTSVKELRFTCNDLNFNECKQELIIEERLWVQDEAGNVDYNNAVLKVVENPNICEGSKLSVSHLDASRRNINFSIDIFNRGQFISTLNSGKMPLTSFCCTYRLFESRPFKEDDAVSGVTTADIIQIKNHLLGKRKITDPYLLIAADVNSSNNITVADIAQMRKLILHGNTITKDSWTFVPKDYIFPDSTYPYLAPRSIAWRDSFCFIQQYFYCIKKGDMHADIRSLNKFSTRENRSKNFFNKINSQDGELRVDIFPEQQLMFKSLQFSLDIPDGLEISRVESNYMNIEAEHYQLIRPNKSYFNFSYDQSDGCHVPFGQPLMTIYFKGNTIENISSIKLANHIVQSEMVDNSDETYTLKMAGTENLSDIFLIPNPIQTQGWIVFSATRNEQCSLEIFDMQNRKVEEMKMSIHEGLNKIPIELIKLRNGHYFYRLNSQAGIRQNRFIILN